MLAALWKKKHISPVAAVQVGSNSLGVPVITSTLFIEAEWHKYTLIS